MQDPKPPEVNDEAWCRSPVDRFVLAKLEGKGMRPAKEAERRTWIRRVYFDLIGLPPTFEQVQVFLEDSATNAYEKVVDTLLNSPHYGERWGRHWLDIARFADTRGYLVGGQNRNFPYAYTYRDFVINSFNEDKPYDLFVREQLAADLLDLGDDKSALAGMGFLTVGRRFLNKQDEIIDDRIDVVTRGLMGLTVYCSRCHDHKYDPVPTSEYYSLYSIFDNSQEPEDLPLLEEPKPTDGYRRYQEGWEKRKASADNKYEDIWRGIQNDLRASAGDYMQLLARKAKPEYFAGKPDPEYVKKNTIRRSAQNRWQAFFGLEQTKKMPLFQLAVNLLHTPTDQFNTHYQELLPHAQPALRERLSRSPPNSYSDLIVVYSRFFRELEDIPDDKLTAGQKDVRAWLNKPGAPTFLAKKDAEKFFNRRERDQYRKLKADIRAWEANSPDAPPRAMVLRDKASQHDNYVFVRGKRGNNGPKVARQFLSVASADKPRPYTRGSGRLELADSILDHRNPFTWRVIVNRIWQHHFGEGLVRTSSDFGTRGETPSHPQLLDYLAQQFIRNGKSFKTLHRELVLSSTYRMASTNEGDYMSEDADNRLLSRMNRQRLEIEPMRDAMLAVSAHINLKVGGRSVQNIIDPNATRRTLYGFVNRQDIPGFYRSFDFTNPDATTGNRPETTVPQQALFAMNSPFVHRQAEGVISRMAKGDSPENRVRQIYQFVLARNPTPEEVNLAATFVAENGADGDVRFAQILLMSNEFMFVD